MHLLTTSSAIAGDVLATAVDALARRRGTKPMHPKGAVLRGTLTRTGEAGSGVPWLDARARDDVLVRWSRGAGLPAALPDVHGLALRHRDGDRVVDLLLSVTGRLPVARHVLGLHRDPARGTYSTLMPFRGPHGPLLVAAVVDPPRRLPSEPAALVRAIRSEPVGLRLEWAGLTTPWRTFGRLELDGPAAASQVDLPLRFDPLAAPPGLETYRWTALLRGPSYTVARRTPADVDGPATATVTPGEDQPDHADHPAARTTPTTPTTTARP